MMTTLGRSAPVLGLCALAMGLSPAPAAAEQAMLVERIADVTVTREQGALVVNAAGTVPISGFGDPLLRPRPDLVKVPGGVVLDFVATPPPRGSPFAHAEARLSASYRIAPPQAESVRFVQVRAATGSRIVQVTGK
ncbi:MAG: hypothetical protein KIT16_22565 [Rhodospirillaceae bacterium]|nr:hypothetical protein [Rhodospirillaceae bacterium]